MFDSKGFHECCKIWGFQRFIKIPPSYFPFLCKAIVKIVIKLFGTRQNRIFGNVTTWIVVIIVTNTLHYIQDGAPHPIRRRWLNDENSRWNQIIDLELINYKLPNSLIELALAAGRLAPRPPSHNLGPSKPKLWSNAITET